MSFGLSFAIRFAEAHASTLSIFSFLGGAPAGSGAYLAQSRFLRRRVSLTQAFCRCYYQMAVQQVTVRWKNQPHLQASG
jgi:hypothetical protein